MVLNATGIKEYGIGENNIFSSVEIPSAKKGNFQ